MNENPEGLSQDRGFISTTGNTEEQKGRRKVLENIQVMEQDSMDGWNQDELEPEWWEEIPSDRL